MISDKACDVLIFRREIVDHVGKNNFLGHYVINIVEKACDRFDASTICSEA